MSGIHGNPWDVLPMSHVGQFYVGQWILLANLDIPRNLWVWLECIGVVSGCCCKEVHAYRYLHNNYYFSVFHLY